MRLLNKADTASDDPLWLVSQIFKEVLLGFGVDKSSAKEAQRQFYALKMEKDNEESKSSEDVNSSLYW